MVCSICDTKDAPYSSTLMYTQVASIASREKFCLEKRFFSERIKIQTDRAVRIFLYKQIGKVDREVKGIRDNFVNGTKEIREQRWPSFAFGYNSELCAR